MKLIPLSPLETPQARERISCTNCIAACCLKNTVMPLTKEEAVWMDEHGTQLRQLDKSERKGNRPGRGREFYILEDDCANLETDPATGMRTCAAYDERPDACRDFKEGGFMCEVMRSVRVPETASEEFPEAPMAS